MSVLQKEPSNILSEKIKAEVKEIDPEAEVILFGAHVEKRMKILIGIC